MRRIITSIALLFAFSPIVHAQELCGFEKRHKQQMQNDPVYKQRVQKMTQDWVNFNQMKESARLLINGNDTVYEIPMVIHVVHTGGPIGSAYNPTDIQLMDLVDYVNKTYQAIWPAYPNTSNGGSRIPFKIVLAARDPDCKPTNGINRVNGTVLSGYASGGIGSPGASDVDVKALSLWPNDQYYNVWVVNKIDDPGVAGYAYYPGAGPSIDGTVILAAYAQAGYSTLVHEFGHGMGLPHTFEGDNGGVDCPPNVDCLLDGDGICDTEPHKRGITCTDVINPCTNTPLNNTQFSFMSYTQGCRDRFTAGQREKVLWNLLNNRASLMVSDGGVNAPQPALPSQCIPTAMNPGSPANVGPQEVSFNNMTRTSGGFNTEGIHVDNFCTHNTEVYLGTSYPISVTTGPQPENVSAYIDYNNDGQFQDPAELVYFHAGATANQVHTGTVNIPATGPVVCQALRMRIISDLTTAPPPTPCGSLVAGQAEDYIVTIKPSTGATLVSSITSGFPGCQDSVISFVATTTNVPGSSSITWLVNGVPAAAGPTWNPTNLQSGDVVTSMTVVNNTTCNTPDTIRSNGHTVSFLPGLPAPVISFVNGDLVASVSPVQWFGPNGLIPGATSQTYHPIEPGNHYAKATGTGCASDKSNVLNVSLLSIGGFSLENVKVYPNPVNNELVIDWGTEQQEMEIDILNMLGQSVIHASADSETKKTIATSQLANGVYFVKITGESGKAGVVRIVVQH